MRYARLGIEEVRDRDPPVAHPVRACTSLMRDEHPPFRLDVSSAFRGTERKSTSMPSALIVMSGVCLDDASRGAVSTLMQLSRSARRHRRQLDTASSGRHAGR